MYLIPIASQILNMKNGIFITAMQLWLEVRDLIKHQKIL